MVTVTNYDTYLNNISAAPANEKLLALIQQTSAATNYLPGTIILVIVFVIIFVSLKYRGVPTITAFTATAFAHMILALIMYPLQILNGIHFYTALVLVPISAFILYVGKK